MAELTRLAEAGQEAACVFVIQRGDCSHFGPCWEKDGQYARLLLQVVGRGRVRRGLFCTGCCSRCD